MRHIASFLICFIIYMHGRGQTIVFTGATAHTGTGQVIEHSVVAVQDGKIIYVGHDGDGTTFKDAQVKDITGMHIYPGFIAANCYIGLNEIDAARPTRDFAEVGVYNPNVRSLIAFNTDSKVIPTLRFNGVLEAQVVPQGGTISGSSSVMSLTSDNWEDGVIKADDGIHLNWHEVYNSTDKKQQELHDQFIRETEQFFAEAEAYIKMGKPEETNLKFEAMKGLYTGTKKLYIHVNTARYISEAVEFGVKHHVKTVIAGGNESYIVTDLLKKYQIPVILMNIHRLPDRPGDAVDLPYKLPYLLKQAGIQFCIAVRGSWEVRNLPFHAGTAAGYGLTREEALVAITGDAAKILGIDATTGTLEKGKEATFFISKGDALDMQGNQLVYAYNKGKSIELKAMQQQLFEKYDQKYKAK